MRDITLRELCQAANRNAVKKGFWAPHPCGKGLQITVTERLALVVTECSEAIEELRVGGNWQEELADIVIRTADLAAGMGVDLTKEVRRKLAKNRKRPKLHGKKF